MLLLQRVNNVSLEYGIIKYLVKLDIYKDIVNTVTPT